MAQFLATVNWMQVVATVVPMFFSATAMFIILAWHVGRKVERLFVVVGTVSELGTRVLVIESDLGAVKADISTLKVLILRSPPS